jgi:hypothetical protein
MVITPKYVGAVLISILIIGGSPDRVSMEYNLDIETIRAS